MAGRLEAEAGVEARRTPSRPKQVWVRSPLERGTGGGWCVAKFRAETRHRYGQLLLGAIATLALATHGPFASAHQTQISDGVGGTHHIEPNDTPRAGEPSQAWFALTQAGGATIGLADCECELVLVGAGGEAIASPALTAIAVEGLTDVPAAELTFPQVGAYVLTMTGSPKGTADFPRFRLDFPITVAAGTAKLEQPLAEVSEEVGNATPDEAEASLVAEVSQAGAQDDAGASGLPLLPIGLAVAVTIFLALFFRGKQSS